MTAVELLLTRARVRARTVMVDTCIVEHLTPGTLNTTTGAITSTPTTVYSGPCRIRSTTAANTTSVERITGDAEQVVHRPVLLLPYNDPGASAADIGDRVTVNSSSTYTVVARLDSTTATARGYLIESVEVEDPPT